MRKAELALYMLVSKGLILVYKRGIKTTTMKMDC